MTFAEAMRRFGSDKPDLRNPLEMVDVADLLKRLNLKYSMVQRMTLMVVLPSFVYQMAQTLRVNKLMNTRNLLGFMGQKVWLG